MEIDLQEIISLKMKEKEKVTVMTAMVKSDEAALAQLFDILRNGTDVQ
jgi:hypothetical protein